MKGSNAIMVNFMINLKRVLALDYLLVPTEKEKDELLFQGEKRFNWNMLERSRLNPPRLDPGVENTSLLEYRSNDNAIFIFEVNAQGTIN